MAGPLQRPVELADHVGQRVEDLAADKIRDHDPPVVGEAPDLPFAQDHRKP